MFRSRGVRLIAVNDGIDSANGEDDFIPFREIMAEFYARDTSRKVKSVLTAKGKSGKPTINSPPYGFIKDPNDKYKWLVDEPATAVVHRIFQLAMDGMGIHTIARMLAEDKVERPSHYHGRQGNGTRKNDYNPDLPYAWRGTTVANILGALEYCGHLVNLRTRTVDFKSRKTEVKPQDEWLIFENHHAAIISREVFDTVQKLRQTKRRIDTLGYANPLTGLLWCADCGEKMYNFRQSKPRKPTEKKRTDVYHCSTYKIAKKDFQSKCSVHHISTEVTRDIILDILKKTIGYVSNHESEFLEKLRKSSTTQQRETTAAHKKLIAKNDKRLADLARVFHALYEDKALGKITEERFADMTVNYDQEIAAAKSENEKLQTELAELEREKDKTDKFLALVRKYTHFEELTNAMINEFIDKIIVHEGVWSEGVGENGRPRGTRTQQVDVYLKYIGNFAVPDMRTPDEVEQERIAAEKLEQKRKYDRECMRRYMARKRAAQAESTQHQTA